MHQGYQPAPTLASRQLELALEQTKALARPLVGLDRNQLDLGSPIRANENRLASGSLLDQLR
jgi:hypothetical protein